MPSIKENFFYSAILTSANYVFPLITYPYVSRVLGVTKIGICNFVDSIVNYYILFSMMGLMAVGIREISASRDDPAKLSRTFSSLFCINTISTFIVAAAFVAAIFCVPKLYEYKELMFVGLFKVIFNYLMVEWFYKGIENFKYITKLGIITKLMYVVSVFAFVRDSSDYPTFYLLSMLMIAANAAVNLTHSRKFIKFSLSGITFRPYMKSFFVLGVYMLLTSMYTGFNVAYLGFVCGETEVGYYTTATKLHSIFLALFTAFTGVMLPRMSLLASTGDVEGFKAMLQKSFHVLFLFAMPVVVFATVYAPQIIMIISGAGYEPAITPMRVVMPLILIIGYEQIAVMQVLMPLKKDRAIFINACIGAVVGIVANVILVGALRSTGSAIVWVLSEVAVLGSASYFISKYIKVGFPTREILKSIVCSVPCILLSVFVYKQVENDFVCILIGSVTIIAYYAFVYVYVLKDALVVSIMDRVRNIFNSPK